MKKRTWIPAVALAALLGVAACTSATEMNKPGPTLYDRLGGQPAITAVVDDFIGNVAADARINGRFANANIPRLKTRLVELISAGSGGKVTYTGRDMRSAHEGMNITDAEFGALVEDLVRSLDKFQVKDKEKSDLLAILGPMKAQIVGH